MVEAGGDKGRGKRGQPLAAVPLASTLGNWPAPIAFAAGRVRGAALGPRPLEAGEQQLA